MYRCIQPLSKAFIEANQDFFPHINGVPKDLNNNVHSALKKEGMHMVYPCSKSTIRCWGLYYSIVSEMLAKSQKQTDEKVKHLNLHKIKEDIFFFFTIKKKKSIKITYKCKVWPLKLDCVLRNSLILTNLKGNNCYSTFCHASVTIWQGFDKNQWKFRNIVRNQAVAHAWWWQRRWWWWWWCLKWQVDMSTESHLLKLVYAKCFLH